MTAFEPDGVVGFTDDLEADLLGVEGSRGFEVGGQQDYFDWVISENVVSFRVG